jgi:protein gp37
MAQNSKIEWTHHTANLWHGCTKVHEGCDNCYAETLAKRWGNDVWGNDKPRKEIKAFFTDLDKYQKLAKEANENHRVFVGSMMDIFEKPMPLIDSKGNARHYDTGKIRELFFMNIDFGKYPNLMFLLLTKRPSNINKLIPENWKTNPPKNVMFGTSPVNQITYTTLVRQLLEVKGKKFLSIEPQLDFISIPRDLYKGIDWIIQGGESGHHKRPFNLDWAYSMKQDCKDLNIPYFFKQIDKVKEIPMDLQVRMFPTEQVGSAFL